MHIVGAHTASIHVSILFLPTVQAGGVVVSGPTDHRLNSTVYVGNVTDSLYLYICTKVPTEHN